VEKLLLVKQLSEDILKIIEYGTIAKMFYCIIYVYDGKFKINKLNRIKLNFFILSKICSKPNFQHSLIPLGSTETFAFLKKF